MTYELFFKSSANERYEFRLTDETRGFLHGEGVTVVEEFGGTDLMEDPDDPNASDNGFVVDTDEVNARRLAKVLEERFSREVKVTKVES